MQHTYTWILEFELKLTIHLIFIFIFLTHSVLFVHGLCTSMNGNSVPPLDPTSIDAYIPPSLLSAQRAILPSILTHLPSMISQIKLKKMDSLRGNRVGIIRTKLFVFTFTFKEIIHPYHMITVSAKRIKQIDAEAKRRRKITTVHTNGSNTNTNSGSAIAASSSITPSTGPDPVIAPIPGASLSSSLSNFPLFPSPLTPSISLTPLSSLRTHSGMNANSNGGSTLNSTSTDDGFYSGYGFASYLVSKHALHIRMIPTRYWKEKIEKEKMNEIVRRNKLERREKNFQIEEKNFTPEEENESISGNINQSGTKRKNSASTSSIEISTAGVAMKKFRQTDSNTIHTHVSAIHMSNPLKTHLPMEEEQQEEEENNAALVEDEDEQWLNMDI
jgi:hypothetical protein